MKRRDSAAPPRFTMTVRTEEFIPESPKGRVFQFHWYPREKRKVTMEQYVCRRNQRSY